MIQCTKCRAELDPDRYNGFEAVPCASCGARLRVETFPALNRRPETVAPEMTAALPDDATCFYHPQKKASAPCDECGRFLCALCEVDMGGRRVCPACIEKGGRKHTLENLEIERTAYDQLAAFLALVPLLLWPLTAVTAPAAVYVSIRYWGAPSSLVRRTKGYFIAALVFAGLEITGWAIFVITLFTS